MNKLWTFVKSNYLINCGKCILYMQGTSIYESISDHMTGQLHVQPVAMMCIDQRGADAQCRRCPLVVSALRQPTSHGLSSWLAPIGIG